jgi:hypothetical protein
VFGPTPPGRWGPPPSRDHHVALWAGHTGDPHASQVDAGLLAITAADVIAALERLPRRQPGGYVQSGCLAYWRSS